MRGRPILGAFCGLLFGIFVAIDLMVFKVRALDNLSVIGLPILGLILGIIIALAAPFGRSRAGGGLTPAPVMSDPPPAAPADEAP